MSTSTELLVQMAKIALEGKTIMITGGSGGIGSAMTRLFKRAGCNVIITGSNKGKLDDFASQLPEDGGDVWGYTCDLRNRKEVEEMVKKVAEERPPIDILINNAGFALDATVPFWEQDPETVETVMDVNLNGLMSITHAVLKYHMMARKPQATGTIINISSITGHQAPPRENFEASYHTSKAGVEGFSNVLRNECLGTNIRVLINRPGTVRTEFHARRHQYDAEKTEATYEGYCPLVAEDIAVSCLWQCLQPERISCVLMETLATGQRSLYAADKSWEERNGESDCKEWV